MLILKYIYQTSLSQEIIKSWIKNKSEERIKIFKIRKYNAKVLSDGFRIQQRRFNEYQAFFPLIIGKFGSSDGTIKLRIQPSVLGALFIGVFWIVPPIIIFTVDKATIDGTLMNLDFKDRLIGLGFVMLIVVPITFIFIIWPNYQSRKWIEKELKLTNRQKMAPANKK